MIVATSLANSYLTRKHSSRMRSTRPPYVLHRHQMSVPDVDPLVNKFEKVSSLGHKMSLAWGRPGVEGILYRG